MYWTNYSKGEIATTLTLITVLVLTVGVFVGTQLAQQNTDTRSRAASSGDGFLVCDAGSDPYNSNSITVTNKTNETIVDIQSVMWSCRYDPNIPIEQGRYKCETCTSGDEINNLNCQIGVHDPSRSTEFTLAPGESKTISHRANACETIQFDVYNEKEQGESPTECYNVSTTVIDPPAPNWWQGGIGFAINQNSNCTGGGYIPPGTNPTPTPATNPTPTPNCPFTNPTTCQQNCSPNSCDPVTGRSGCYKCGAGAVPTPTPNPNATNCEDAFPGAQCKLGCDLVSEVNKGSTYCTGGSLVDRRDCCAPKPTSTPTPTRTPTPTTHVGGQPTATPTPQSNNTSLTCADLTMVRVPVTNNVVVAFQMPGSVGAFDGWRSYSLGNVPINSEFTFAQIYLDGDTTCRVTV
ncbi:hypothetical protein HY469_02000 [Candidatus Roizmanbacteria bacterium]|nr:hypothetical protein [Candidatus Roizmanbacteria bacterium]